MLVSFFSIDAAVACNSPASMFSACHQVCRSSRGGSLLLSSNSLMGSVGMLSVQVLFFP